MDDTPKILAPEPDISARLARLEQLIVRQTEQQEAAFQLMVQRVVADLTNTPFMQSQFNALQELVNHTVLMTTRCVYLQAEIRGVPQPSLDSIFPDNPKAHEIVRNHWPRVMKEHGLSKSAHLKVVTSDNSPDALPQ